MPVATSQHDSYYIIHSLKARFTDAHSFLYCRVRNIVFFDIKFLPRGCKYIKISCLAVYFSRVITFKVLRHVEVYVWEHHLDVIRTQATFLITTQPLISMVSVADFLKFRCFARLFGNFIELAI